MIYLSYYFLIFFITRVTIERAIYIYAAHHKGIGWGQFVQRRLLLMMERCRENMYKIQKTKGGRVQKKRGVNRQGCQIVILCFVFSLISKKKESQISSSILTILIIWDFSQHGGGFLLSKTFVIQKCHLNHPNFFFEQRVF